MSNQRAEEIRLLLHRCKLQNKLAHLQSTIEQDSRDVSEITATEKQESDDLIAEDKGLVAQMERLSSPQRQPESSKAPIIAKTILAIAITYAALRLIGTV